ncbi:MAG TPA: hypothetical protein VG738_05070 [Chitinophagaceae bacterium]|nr:hypothetical protein [Chitinophagaceae bacterium]
MSQKYLSIFGRGAIWTIFIFCTAMQCCGQTTGDWKLEKMPADLETDFALSALPPQLRGGATVYLNDPEKGLYISRKGTNGFVCFIARTEWEWAEFRQDVAAPISYDAEGAKAIMPVYIDVSVMRASGKFSPAQIKDTVIARIKRGYYKAPSRPGISYMEAPMMRVYTSSDPKNNHVASVSMPHYMYYAPYLTAAELGVDSTSSQQPFLVNPDAMTLGNSHRGPYEYLITPLNEAETAKILAAGQALLKRLADYKPYFKVEGMMEEHHH